MILAIDIGNTNIVVGCIDDQKTYFIERLATVRTKTELEYAVDLKTLLEIYHIKKADIEGCIISSVVPQITNIAKLAAEKILKKEVMVLGPGVKTGLNIMMDNPGQLGADLVAGVILRIILTGNCNLLCSEMKAVRTLHMKSARLPSVIDIIIISIHLDVSCVEKMKLIFLRNGRA